MTATVIQNAPSQCTEDAAQREAKFNIQVLRGIACLAVIWSHVGTMIQSDPAYKAHSFFVPHSNLRPLLFFMLSGYVIGVGNKKAFTNWGDIKRFITKRFFRIYPVYALIVAFTFAVSNDANPVSGMFTHLVFMQNVTGELISENGPLWSMSFEVLFYLLFIFISFFRLKPPIIIILAVSFGLVLLITHSAVPMLISCCFGLVFWAIGLFSANYKFEEAQYPTSYFISLVILILCYQKVEAGIYLINKLNIPHLDASAVFGHYRVKLTHLQFAPVCFLILYSFNNKKIKYHSCLLAFVYLPPLVRLAYLAYSHKLQPELLWPGILFIISAALLLVPFNLKVNWLKNGLREIGDVSYSLYLIHFPLACLFMKASFFTGSWPMGGINVGLYLGLIYLVAYFLENHYQSFVVSMLTNAKPGVVPQRIMTVKRFRSAHLYGGSSSMLLRKSRSQDS